MNNFTKYLNLFFNDYLTLQLNCSNNTLKSYKYTFKLLLNYLINIKEIKLKDIDFKVLTKDNIKDFRSVLVKGWWNIIIISINCLKIKTTKIIIHI